MRLVCPKCAAQYEVPQEAIPEAGRDVQCSDCGHGWFQAHPEPPVQRTLVAELAPPPAVAAPPRKPLDENVMAILREEALREAAARRGDASRKPARHGDAAPPGAALTGAAPAAPPPAAAPFPATRAEDPQATLIRPGIAVPVPPLPPSTARLGLLPDIEEINSTLAAGSPRRSPLAPARPDDPRPGFRTGFGLMMALMALAAATYLLAPRIATAVPETQGAMTAFVGTVDDLRRGLDAAVTSVQQRVGRLLTPVE